jgi:hypothetical protein
MLADDLKTALGCDEFAAYDKVHMKIARTKVGFEVEYGKMYESPGLGFAKLVALSKIFGTDEIDVDNYANAGCESCDYGSSYGHTIQINNPTLNVAEMGELVGKDLLAKP